eukprot:gb/GEZJ01000133.1/.p1 GENE.gb/GEZJ01000133.1/~~gb/GEZJ01000133.1/.p1  ORF type:complete len:104 (+),score=7.25 gb/GEZJ01000133.1/:171-482(+)
MSHSSEYLSVSSSRATLAATERPTRILNTTRARKAVDPMIDESSRRKSSGLDLWIVLVEKSGIERRESYRRWPFIVFSRWDLMKVFANSKRCAWGPFASRQLP